MNEQPNFFDSRTISAIILVVVTWVGWQYYMQKKYPDAYKKKVEITQPVRDTENAETIAALPAPSATPAIATAPANTAEVMTDFHSPQMSFQISSKGMGITQLRLLEYTNRKGEVVEFSLAHPPRSFETRLLGVASAPIDFNVEKVSENMYIGHAKVGNVELTKTMQIDPTKYALDIKISAQGQDPKFVGLSDYLSDDVVPTAGGNFLNRNQFDRQEAFLDAADSHNNHLYFSTDVIDKSWPKGHVVALGSQYFTQAIVDHSPLIPDIKLHVDPKKSAVIELQYSNVSQPNNMVINYTAFAGPKSFSLLKSVDEELVPLIDFGMFSWIARYILVMLKGFFALVGNWGLAIILLTVLVRLLVLPFNIMSYKSMKSMQALQPQMKALRERHKDDQQKLNQEMMTLLRAHKVNPLGGCLPILLQFPIFLALYQVLGHSIELYQAPFGLWIHDLSLKDPFYILPVLMGITMFLQQRITPNTLDPAQAKILMFMPLMFAFFMLSLPSGLTLYILVSALFAVIQQFYFMKSHNPLVEER